MIIKQCNSPAIYYFLLTLMGALCFAQPELLIQQHIQSIRSLSDDVLKELLLNTRDNVFVSPLSVQIGLAMLQLGARGTTLTQLAKALHLPENKTALEQMFENFCADFSKRNNDSRYDLTIANRVFLKEGFEVTEAFSSSLADYFQAELGRVDFSDKEESVGRINAWIEQQTNHKIKNLLTTDAISDNTQMILVNTVYFLGKWLKPFPIRLTQMGAFYKFDSGVPMNTEMMSMTEFLNYYENRCLDAKFLQLPYQGEDISMTIVLPNNRSNGVSYLFERNCSIFGGKSYRNVNVLVKLPKFKFDKKTIFNDILMKLGAGIAFTNGADFSGVTDKLTLGIDLVLQQAFIDVTESGTEAAAATAVAISKRASFIELKQEEEFVADHPFLFYLSDKNGYILFVGRYTGAELVN